MTRALSTKRLPALVGVILAMILTISLVPASAHANDTLPTQTTIASGTSGTCNWEISNSNVLRIVTDTDAVAPNEDGTLDSFSLSMNPAPWIASNLANTFQTAVIHNVNAGESLYGVFLNCKNLKLANLTDFYTDNTMNMSKMFSGCTALVDAYLLSFKTDKVTDMSYMFEGCKSLIELDLSRFNTSKVKSMKGMFDGCDSLKTVTLGPFFTFTDGCTLPAGTWRSKNDGKVYTAEEIAKNHGGVEDTYTKVSSPSSGNNNSGSNNANNGSADSMNVYRLYNPNNGDHFYTADASERDWLSKDIGWIDEGVAWVGPKTGGNVYRLYNPNNGDHFYTTDASECNWLRGLGWTYEGVGWHTTGSDGVPLYRLFNPYAQLGAHLWTTDKTERDWLARDIGWVAEDVGWYVLSAK